MYINRDVYSYTQKTIAILTAAALTLLSVPAPAHDRHESETKLTAKSSLPVILHNPTSAMGQMTPMPVVAPLFIQDHDFSSALHLVNGLNISTYADVTLTDLDGKEITQRRVDFAPHSQRQLEISALLLSAISPATAGRITVMQSPELQGITINSQLSITYLGAREPNYLDEELAMPSAEGSQTLRAVSDSVDRSPVVAVTSLADSVQHVLVECLGGRDQHFSKSVELAAGKTLVTEACAERTRPGADLRAVLDSAEETVHGPFGVSLTTDAMPGSFAAFGFVPHRKHEDRFFTTINFTDPKMTMSPNIVFTGVPIGATPLLAEGKYVPQVTLANFSNKNLNLAIKYSHTSGESPAVQGLAKLAIPARSTKRLSFDSLQGEPDLKNSFLITSDGNPGDLVARLSSSSDPQLPEVELLAKDAGDISNGGDHPWSVENRNESTLLLFNHSADPQHFNVHIGNGGVLWQKDLVLQPMETRSISLRELIDTKVKDDQGKTLSQEVTSGQVGWFASNRATGKGRLLLSNRDAAMARNFSCGITLVVCSATGTTFSIPISFGDTLGYPGFSLVWCQPFSDAGCSGIPQASGGTASNYTWTTSLPAIVPISGSSTSQTVNLVGNDLGTSQITETVYSNGCSIGGGGPAPVQPWVQITSTSLNPISISQTTTSTLTVQIAHSDMSSITNPSVTLEITTASSNPSGITLIYTNPGPTVTVDLTQPSPISKTFTVGYGSGSLPGSAVIQASITHQSPANSFIVKDPNPASNGTAPLNITN